MIIFMPDIFPLYIKCWYLNNFSSTIKIILSVEIATAFACHMCKYSLCNYYKLDFFLKLIKRENNAKSKTRSCFSVRKQTTLWKRQHLFYRLELASFLYESIYHLGRFSNRNCCHASYWKRVCSIWWLWNTEGQLNRTLC